MNKSAPRLKPLSNRVLVRQLEKKGDKMVGGLYIPDSAQDAPLKGEIVAIGEGILNNENQLIKMGVRVGQICYYEKFNGQKLSIDNEEFLIFRESDLLAVEL